MQSTEEFSKSALCPGDKSNDPGEEMSGNQSVLGWLWQEKLSHTKILEAFLSKKTESEAPLKCGLSMGVAAPLCFTEDLFWVWDGNRR